MMMHTNLDSSQMVYTRTAGGSSLFCVMFLAFTKIHCPTQLSYNPENQRLDSDQQKNTKATTVSIKKKRKSQINGIKFNETES